MKIVIIGGISKKKIIFFTIMVSVFIIAIVYIPAKIQKIVYKKEYSEYVEKYADTYCVDKNLIYTVIKAESNFNPNAKSSKGAIGLMQLVESTAEDVRKQVDLKVENELNKELLKPDININLGTKYLSILIDRYQNIEIAITAYNAGIGTVDNWIEKGIIKADGTDVENIPYKETNNYVRKILRDYKIYMSL